ncbi:MAG: hypothetical protein Q8P27_01385, partial [Candidatus Peregrinibacteria bacterium]|nr:hypothetical protein [Candidatus Peregrinibacteria bacterium]
MISKNLHHWHHDNENSLRATLCEQRFVFVNGAGEGGSTADATNGASGATTAGKNKQGQPQPPQDLDQGPRAREQVTEQQLQSERNKQYAKKIESLSAAGSISKETAAEATEALTSKNKHIEKLARQLSAKQVSGDMFDMAHEALENGTNSEKAIARNFVAGKVTPSIFQNVITDLESNDAYAAPLARRIANGQVDSEEYEKARIALSSDDADEKHSAQMLARANMTPEVFRTKMAMAERQKQDPELRVEQEEDQVKVVQKETHDKIAELLITVNVIMEQLPEQERTKPLVKLRQNLRRLNDKDRENADALTAYLK